MRLLTFLCCALLLAGCGDEEGSSTYIAATIDGTEWRGTADEAQLVYTVDGTYLVVIGVKNVGDATQLFYLDLPYPVGTGTFKLGADRVLASWMSCPGGPVDCIFYAAVPSDTGTLVIGAIEPNSGRIQGSFYFTGYALGDTLNPTKQFTNGTFDIRAPAAFRLE